MRETMQPMCWPDGKRNFELCCFFRFGPTLRGLPFESEDADGVVFDFRSLQLKLRSSGSPGFWPAAWIFARLLADVRQAQQQADAFHWPEGAERLSRLPDRPLRILDVSCGAGLSSVLGAARGHNVSCTEVTTELLQLAGRNAAKNGVKLRLRKWDVRREPSWRRPRTRFDLCLLDLTYFNLHYRKLQLHEMLDETQHPPISRVLPVALRHLRSFLGDCCLYAFAVVESDWKVIREGLPEEMAFSNFTSELLRSLRHFSASDRSDVLRDCGAGHAGKALLRPPPSISPLGWLENAGWTPPIFHHLVLW